MDAAFVLRLLNEPSFIQNIGDRMVRTEEAARNYIDARFVSSYRQNGYGLYMVETSEGIPVGMCGLVKRDPNEDPDIGFAFVPESWRRGFAFEAATAVMYQAKNVLQLRRVLGICIPGNTASRATLEKLGLKLIRMDVSSETQEPICVYEILL